MQHKNLCTNMKEEIKAPETHAQDHKTDSFKGKQMITVVKGQSKICKKAMVHKKKDLIA